MAEPIDVRVSIGSHTDTEFGRYDAEPFEVEGNAYYWYKRAVYWKREANRKEGVQSTMEFQEKSHMTPTGVITLSSIDLAIVKGYLAPKSYANGQTTLKISAIKHVRTVTNCGLKEAKDYVETLEKINP